MAENVNATLHNIYTLRGAPVRDPLNWSKYISEALYRFGLEAEVMFASHHWPRWGNDRIQEVLRGQRDLYANMNNQVLHLANQGVTINEIHNVYEVPKSLQEKWYCRGYHGSPQHNSRGVIQRFLGFWDCNPATLIPLSPADSAPLYVEMMGGAAKIIARGQAAARRGQVPARPGDPEQARAGRAAEPGRRRTCWPTSSSRSATSRRTRACATASSPAPTSCARASRRAQSPNSSSPDVIRAMSTELFLNFLGIRMDSRKAEGHALHHQPHHAGQRREVRRSSWRTRRSPTSRASRPTKPDLTLTINRSDLEQTMMGAKTLEAQIADGTAKVEGDVSDPGEARGDDGRLRPALRDPARHEGARRRKPSKADAYEAVPGQTHRRVTAASGQRSHFVIGHRTTE